MDSLPALLHIPADLSMVFVTMKFLKDIQVIGKDDFNETQETKYKRWIRVEGIPKWRILDGSLVNYIIH